MHAYQGRAYYNMLANHTHSSAHTGTLHTSLHKHSDITCMYMVIACHHCLVRSLLTDPPAAPLYVKLTIVSITSGDVKGLGDRACYWALMHSIGLCGIVHCMHLPKHMFTSGLSNVTIVSLVTLYNTEQLSALNLVYYHCT